MYDQSFGQWFAEIREKSGYSSQRQLATVSNIANSTIARIESGKQKPEPETLHHLATYLPSTSYEELMIKAGYLNSESKKTKKTLRDLIPTETIYDIPVDFEEIMNNRKVLFDGVPMTDEEKEWVLGVMKVTMEKTRKTKEAEKAEKNKGK